MDAKEAIDRIVEKLERLKEANDPTKETTAGSKLMSTLTWLHLSDFHAHSPGNWDAERVTRTLVGDLTRLHAEHGLRPDLLFFTGDAAFGHLGDAPKKRIADQFATFLAFLDQVRTAFNPEIPRTDVYLVPGNHDVNRKRVGQMDTAWLDGHESLAPVEATIDSAGLEWGRLMERLHDYRDFLASNGFDHLLQDRDRLIQAHVRKIRGRHIGIAGFNSAWSCCRNNEHGQLWMAGKWQQERLWPTARDSDFAIALMHHPPDWLREYEEPHFGRRLRQDYRFLLHGHEHRDWVLPDDQGYHVIAAGACYESSHSEHNGYNIVRLDLDRRQGEVWLRRYSDDGTDWIPRIIPGQTNDRGVRPIKLPWATKPSTRQPTPRQDPEPPPELDGPLDHYLQCLRAHHRNLPMAGFETTVRLPIQIDSVYIPLRARAMADPRHAVGAWRELAEDHTTFTDESDLPFDRALVEAHRLGRQGVVVLGDPGSGKTTLLKHYILAATDPLIGPAALGLPPDTVPVLIELRKLTEPTAGLRPAIAEAVRQANPTFDSEHADRFVDEHLLANRRNLLILVDGLDEVADDDKRSAVSRWLEQVVKVPNLIFVVTSRYAGYKRDARLDGNFLELHVRDVEPADARRFIQAWYHAVENRAEVGRDPDVAAKLALDQANDLEHKIFDADDQRVQRLRELATSPLMLQILCLVHRDKKQLPERRVELYRECVRVLLELWRRAKNMPLDFDAEQALRLLQPLAYHLHVSERREAQLDELLPHLEAPLRELRWDKDDGIRLLEAIRDQSGVLVFLGQGSYGFLHLSFQEYLAALHIQDRAATEPEILHDLAEQFGDPWWREVTLLALGLNNPSLFKPVMSAFTQAGVLHRDAALADDCLRDALTASAHPLLRALARGIESDQERYHTLRLLRGLKDWKEIEVEGRKGSEWVARLRDDRDEQVQGLAVELVGGKPKVQLTRSRAASVAETTERVHEKDSSVLVLVPGGTFTLGTDDDLEAYFEENRGWPKPEHRVKLSPFWIGKYPVTNEQYRRFLEATEHTEPKYWHDKQFDNPEQPVVGISWLDAEAYCRWAQLELPTEAQWEAAARGFDGRLYPWGNTAPTPEHANYDDTGLGRTSPVGAYPKGAGPFGTLDQAGNVWEWCRDAWDETAYKDRDGATDPMVRGNDVDKHADRVVRGGSWAYPARDLPAAIRLWDRAGLRIRFFGFRVLCRFRPEP